MEFIFTILLIIKGSEIIEFIGMSPELVTLLPTIICGALCMFVTMSSTTYPSISLEGKSFWILRAHPIRVQDIFFAKISANLIIGFPTIVIAAITSWFVIPMKFFDAIIILILPLLIQIFVALFGLVVNLILPRFNWVNETVVIKQSGSSIIGVFGGIAFVGLPVLLYALLFNGMDITINTFLMACVAYAALSCVGLYAYLMTKGIKRFESL